MFKKPTVCPWKGSSPQSPPRVEDSHRECTCCRRQHAVFHRQVETILSFGGDVDQNYFFLIYNYGPICLLKQRPLAIYKPLFSLVSLQDPTGNGMGEKVT